MRYLFWTLILISQLVRANDEQVANEQSKPEAAITVTDSKVTAKCKITHKGQEIEGVDEQCTGILKDVFSSLRQQTQTIKK